MQSTVAIIASHGETSANVFVGITTPPTAGGGAGGASITVNATQGDLGYRGGTLATV